MNRAHAGTGWWRAAAVGLMVTGSAVAWAAAGGLDPSFGTGGVVVTDAAGEMWGSSVQSDGRILAVGARSNPAGGTSSWWIRRYNSDGTDDVGFGTGGLVTLFGTYGPDLARRVAVDPSARIVVVGTSSTSSAGRIPTIVRLHGNGTLDGSFGTGGIVQLTVPGSTATSNGNDNVVLLQPDGRIVVAGRAWFSLTKKSQRLYPFVARYNENGTSDTAFGVGGFAVDKRPGENTGMIWAVARQSTGDLVLAQRRTVNWVITRFRSTGTVDTSFPIIATADWIGGLSVDRFDRIVGSGRNTYTSGDYDILVVRYLAGGTLDTTFGVGGRKVVHVYAKQNAFCSPVFQPADDKIVLGALLFPTSSGAYSVATTVRLLDDGSIDGSFGFGGVAEVVDGGGSGLTAPRGVGLSPDGGIVLAGTAPNLDWFVARYLPN